MSVHAGVGSCAGRDAAGSRRADRCAGRGDGRSEQRVASVPDRVAALVPDRNGLLAAMPGFVPSAGVLMAKLVSLFPRNAGTALPTHQAVIVGFDCDTGEPVAVMDGTAITAIRTGACSALSARLLARSDAAVLAVLGSGVQARSHARAMCRVRPIRQVRIAGRDFAKATALATELAEELPAEVVAVVSYPEALDGADIACATTHTVVPVVRREWLTPGVHITSVGYNPAGREVDDATIAEALVCVESRQAVLAPSPRAATICSNRSAMGSSPPPMCTLSSVS